MAEEGVDVAAKDFLAGMTDRYAGVALRGAVRPALLERLADCVRSWKSEARSWK